MYCPLCESEYREGIETCPACGATLVAADAAEEQRHPLRRAWETADRQVFEQASGLLREAGIPFHARIRNDHWLYRLLGRRPHFEAHLLQADEARAAPLLAGLQSAQREIEAALEMQPSRRCPLCQAEFPFIYTECPICNADLTEWLLARDGVAMETSSVPVPELVWRGGDPVVYAAAVASLIDSGIPCFTSPNNRHMFYALAVARPQMDIRVAEEDCSRAELLLREYSDLYVFDMDVGANGKAVTPETRDVIIGGPATSPEAEAWSGTDASISHAVRASLKEHRFVTRTWPDTAGTERIFVHSAAGERARAIVHEILSQHAELQPPEPLPELLERKAAFHRSLAYVASGIVLITWVAVAVGRRPFEDNEGWRQAAIAVIGLCGSALLLVGCRYLLRAWAFRYDKPARIYLLFALYWIMLLASILISITFVNPV